ncbi:MAG: TIGR03087 family PEP-CTERM/XrtA system glycosyltransferase [Gammaproteobacteria bacterium]|nr:TIGR03087 family PEP-CTERM/XrtA system glycosyltransferase [Gammaproteobacteria bacterium]
MNKKLLLLVHRLPYPPNKGDKIASFNLLRFLSKRYDVYLGTFIDDPDDRQYVDEVRKYCVDLCAPEIDPKIARIASLRGLFTGEALSLPYLRSAQLQRWTDRVLREQLPERVVVFSGPMAQYVSGRLPSQAISLFDMVDVDSEKWRSYGERKAWPMSWLYRREADRLLEFERRMAAEFDSTVFVSKEEAELFRGLAPESAGKITYRIQGVDSHFFDPAQTFDNPYPEEARVLVFTGAMDYWPNIDAVTWFADEAFPRIREAVPEAMFCIVGKHPSPEVQKLAERGGCMVTGGVPDVRPYLAHAHGAALALRIARGIQNKVLEAMAMQLPVLATSGAMTGIQPYPGFEPTVSDDAGALTDAAIELLRNPRRQDTAARACVHERYDWDANLERIARLLETGRVEADI